MEHSTTPALQRIIELEAERAALYARAGRWLAAHERERLKHIDEEIVELWDLRRQEKAGTPEGAMPDNVQDEEAFAAPRGARGQYRSRQRGGLTWAEAEAQQQEG